MDSRLLAGLILLPFLVVFVYATWTEMKRWKSEGRAQYGLTYDEETGTSHVTALDEDDDGFDPETYDPDAANEQRDDTEPSDDADDTTRGA